MQFVEYLPAIISAIGTIVAAFFAYNQYAKNKITDYKVEQWRLDAETRRKRRSDSTALVFAELWEMLHELSADRVYIVQPHPLGDESMISVYFETKRKGVESMRPRVTHLKMEDVPSFCGKLAKEDYIAVQNIAAVADTYARSLLSAGGTERAFIKRLSDNTHDWVGSIFCEFTTSAPVDADAVEQSLKTAATNIQYILPEFRD